MAKLLILIAACGVVAGLAETDDATAMLQAGVEVHAPPAEAEAAAAEPMSEEDFKKAAKDRLRLKAEAKRKAWAEHLDEFEKQIEAGTAPGQVLSKTEPKPFPGKKQARHAREEVAGMAGVEEQVLNEFHEFFPTKEQKFWEAERDLPELEQHVALPLRKPAVEIAHDLVYRFFPTNEQRKLNQLSSKQVKYARKSAHAWQIVEKAEKALQDELYPLSDKQKMFLQSQNEGGKANAEIAAKEKAATMTIEQANTEDESFVAQTLKETVEAHKKMYDEYQAKLADMQQNALTDAQAQEDAAASRKQEQEAQLRATYANMGDYGAYQLSGLGEDKSGGRDGLDETHLNFELAAAKEQQGNGEEHDQENWELSQGNFKGAAFPGFPGYPAARGGVAHAGDNSYEVAEALATAKATSAAAVEMALRQPAPEEGEEAPEYVDPLSDNEAEVEDN